MPLSEERDVALQNHRLNKRKLSENGDNENNTKGCVQIILSAAEAHLIHCSGRAAVHRSRFLLKIRFFCSNARKLLFRPHHELNHDLKHSSVVLRWAFDMKMSNIMYIFLGLLKLWDFVDQYFAQNSFASRDVLAYSKCMYTEPVWCRWETMEMTGCECRWSFGQLKSRKAQEQEWAAGLKRKNIHSVWHTTATLCTLDTALELYVHWTLDIVCTLYAHWTLHHAACLQRKCTAFTAVWHTSCCGLQNPETEEVPKLWPAPSRTGCSLLWKCTWALYSAFQLQEYQIV